MAENLPLNELLQNWHYDRCMWSLVISKSVIMLVSVCTTKYVCLAASYTIGNYILILHFCEIMADYTHATFTELNIVAI